jgi:hypothetical protein
MQNPEASGLGQEWITLQNNYEQYEKGALLIKLVAILLCGLGFVLALHEVVMVLLLLVLWLQEGIYRTYQARLGVRIGRIERGIEAGEILPFQLHSGRQRAATDRGFALCVAAGVDRGAGCDGRRIIRR